MGDVFIYFGIASVFLLLLAFWGIHFLFSKRWKQLFRKNFDYVILSLHIIVLLLYVSPFNWWKFWQTLLLIGFYYVGPLLIFGFILFWLTRRRFKRAIILLFTAVILLVACHHAYDIRKNILVKTIDWFYCSPGQLERGQEILGGVYSNGGCFENSTHCLLTVCKEEHFCCDYINNRK